MDHPEVKVKGGTIVGFVEPKKQPKEKPAPKKK